MFRTLRLQTVFTGESRIGSMRSVGGAGADF